MRWLQIDNCDDCKWLTRTLSNSVMVCECTKGEKFEVCKISPEASDWRLDLIDIPDKCPLPKQIVAEKQNGEIELFGAKE